ncbi:MAG: c-type cytochrome [Proteobacteria bacterium]|nr:c-type cytochrome [Cystobacterineae bacterium]MCL2258593.1 c-type cytochrome [Cystobacterineae bacterium]MCL2314967.1 c-type cytochrome [Pseudomonadota bacterium]
MSKNNKVHHVYDGIEEEDNRLPNWWVAILLGSIFFSFGYWFVYETTKTLPSPLKAYQTEKEANAAVQAKLAAGAPLNDDTLWAMVKDEATLGEGKKVFAQICVSCHLDKAQGSIGPNLTDEYWLHGSKPMDIINAVTGGFPDKGMEAWGARLGPERVKQVAVFVLSIRDSKVPGKAPEGVDYQGNPAPK